MRTASNEIRIRYPGGVSCPALVGDDFKTTVKSVGRNKAKLDNIRVFVNGREILREEDAPVTITADMDIEIKPYDEAGVATRC